MPRDQKEKCDLATLTQELKKFRITASSVSPQVTLASILATADDCRIVKKSTKRIVYYIRTPQKGYFLKLSRLVRSKDRRRHYFLPFRKWAEWRNFHRLASRSIAAAKPVMKGIKRRSRPVEFFLLTEEINSRPLDIRDPATVRKIGQFVAGIHSKGVYHKDLHPANLILTADNRITMIDTQEIYFLPWLPRWLRVHNLGQLFFGLAGETDQEFLIGEFSKGYGLPFKDSVDTSQILRASERHRQRRLRSRSKRCCKDSTEFIPIKEPAASGYKRREFNWGEADLKNALTGARTIKTDRMLAFENVAIKIHQRKRLHQDRCLVSWKMSRALEVRNISVPRALGYFHFEKVSYFLSEFLVGSVRLNEYLSSLSDGNQKRRIFKKLALWVRQVHDRHIWQRDFKSSNILCLHGDFFMVDLDSVKIKKLSEDRRIINLAQLNASLSNAVTRKDRLRFFNHYWSGAGLTRAEQRAIFQKIWDISKTKTTSYYDLDLDQL